MLSLLSLTMMGQDFMEVYFKDGIYKKFYLEGLKEWKVSQYDADGVKHADYNYQHIKTNTHDFVFELEKIDSIVFTKFDEEKVKQDFCETMSVVISVLSKYENKEDIESKLDQIIKTEGVEDAWCDEYYLYVKFRNWETISFQLAYIDFEDNNIDSTYVNQMKSYIPQFRSVLSQDGRKPSFAFINQQQLDTNRKDQIKLGESLVEEFIKCGFNPDSKYIDNPTIEFFDGPIYEYDLIHLLTHGNYLNGQHHFVTAEVLGEFFSLQDEISDENWEKIGKSFIDMMDMTEKYKYKGLSYIGYTYTQEWRGIKLCLVGHPCILEDFFGEYGISSGTFRPNAILFDGACDNMNGDDEEKYSLADKLIKNHGLRLFLGYEGTNTKSPWASNEFYRALLCGKSTKVAFNELDPKYRNEFMYGAVLMDRYNNDYDDEYFFITSTITSELDQETVASQYKNSKVISFQGYTTSLDPQKIKCGFLYSTDKNLSSAKNVIDNAPVKGSQPFADGRGNVVFRYDIKDLQPGNTYYYCAYTFDGEYYNCGDTLSFYVPVVSSSESYAVYNAGTLTFYHDQFKNSRDGSVYGLNTEWNYPGWYYSHDEINKVVFDKSFANARPTSTYLWFMGMRNLTSIEGIYYLNTSEVTNMYGMFLYCENLTSLDVSSFDTRNVTDMYCMFAYCENLASIDVSNFSTEKVTNMSCMFLKCEKLTSLNISNFDTRNVTDMSEMFSCCSSLTTLNVSNFDTRNVTDMPWMFYDCKSLTSLNVSSFNTEKVTNMCCMFYWCENLTSLDVSNFDTRNVTDMRYMFFNCWNLNTLDVSNFIMAVCEDSECMLGYCDGLNTLAVSFTMENLNEDACAYVGYYEPCSIIAPEGFNFGVDTSGNSFVWKSGTFTTGNSVGICPDQHHPHMIDLGLPSGKKWACCNVGASSPEKYGGFYAWGETSEKNVYDWSTYIYCDGSWETCYDIGDDISGTNYDVAHVHGKWGGNWRMPNMSEAKELFSYCSHEETYYNGVNGYMFTGLNGNSIFIPAAGYKNESTHYRNGDYGALWLSTIGDNYYEAVAFRLLLNNPFSGSYSWSRNRGLSVRPIHP